jgi:predicted dehydrogenase
VASRSAERASAFAGKYKTERWYDSWEGVAGDPDIDIVYVATHHPFHFENTRMCLEAGKAVLCEKPFTMNRHELEQLVGMAAEQKVFLMEAIWTRFLPSTRKVLAILETGELGKLTNVYADFGFRLAFDPEHRLYDPAKGGGALIDLGIYPVFLSQLLAGPPKRIEAMARFAPTGVDHSCNMVFEHGNEVVSSLNCTLESRSPVEASLLFEQGWIRMESWWLTPGPLTIHPEGSKSKRIKFRNPGHGYHYEAAEVMNCLDRGLTESPSLPLRFSLDLMGTLDQVRKICRITYPQNDG